MQGGSDNVNPATHIMLPAADTCAALPGAVWSTTAMRDALLIVLRAVIAGGFVVGFSLLGEVLQPKRFAGLFGAAPSVALANLIVVVAALGTVEATADARSMIAGAVGFVAYCLLERTLLPRLSAGVASALCSLLWLAVAAALYLAVVR